METTTITGRVTQVNDKGLKLEGADQWANVSKWAVGVVMPTRGQHVVLALDKSGFVRTIEPIAEAPTTVAPAPVATQQAAPAVVATPAASATEVSGPAPDRDRLIVRQTCVKAAAEIAAGYPRAATSQDAATAALCAGDQGKFWEFHDQLY